MPILIQPSFSKGEVTPESLGRVDTAMYRSALKTARNLIVGTYGGIKNRPGFQFVGFATSNSSISRLRRFRYNTVDTYMLEFSDLKLRVIKNDHHVLEAQKTVTGVTAANPAVVTIASHGYVAGQAIETDNTFAGPVQLNGRRFIVHSATTDTFTLEDPVTNTVIDGSGFAAWTAGGKTARVYEIASPYAAADLRHLKFVQNANTLTITHVSYDERSLTRSSDTSWAFSTPTFAPSIAAPANVVVTPSVTGAITAQYVVTAISAATGEESLASAPITITNGASPAANVISWDAQAAASLFSVYKAVNGITGFIGDTPNNSFNDNNYAPVLSTTPPSARNPFSGSGNQAATAVYYQQRLIRGGSSNLPDTLQASQTGNPYNMSQSTPSVESDAFAARLTSKEVNEIRFFVPLKDLLVMTAGNEFRIFTNGQGFAASTLDIMPQSAWGCSHLEPIVIGLTALFVTENAIRVRTARYGFTTDSYAGEDTMLLSNHLLGQHQLLAWAGGQMPDPLIVGVRSDGQMTCLTYQEEQQVNGWTHWDTDGTVEDVDVVRPKLADTVLDETAYISVVRRINGHNVRMIEKLHTRRFYDLGARDCFFVDAGLSYDNPITITAISAADPVVVTAAAHGFSNGDLVDIYDVVWEANTDSSGTSTQPAQLNTKRYSVTSLSSSTFSLQDPDTLANIDGTAFNAYVSGGTARKAVSVFSGLHHLEGRSIIALGDGNVIRGLTVSGGSITTPYKVSRLYAGLSYVSDFETLDAEVQQGTIMGQIKRIPFVTVKVTDSRGFLAGETTDDLVEAKWRQDEAMGDPTAVLSGNVDVNIGSAWNNHGRIFIRQIDPLPLHILDVVPDVELGT